MGDSASTGRVSAWLNGFGAALERGDIPAILALFDDDCYWRDLVAFTWNIFTAEGKEAIRQMLQATLAQAKPGRWKIEGEASDSGGITAANVGNLKLK